MNKLYWKIRRVVWTVRSVWRFCQTHVWPAYFWRFDILKTSILTLRLDVAAAAHRTGLTARLVSEASEEVTTRSMTPLVSESRSSWGNLIVFKWGRLGSWAGRGRCERRWEEDISSKHSNHPACLPATAGLPWWRSVEGLQSVQVSRPDSSILFVVWGFFGFCLPEK